MKKIETTLLILKRENDILLAMKKEGFGVGKYNGVGGKVKENETIEDAMIRESQEEISVTPTEYEKVGIMDFIEYYKGEKVNLKFHLYIATKWLGNPTESNEMKPTWFKVDKIPYDNMFEDDKYWLPHILNNEKIYGHFEFDENWNLLSHKLEPFEEIKRK